MYTKALISGGVLAALAVILGAFGAHALKEVLTPDLLQSYETGVRYQFYHSFALLICGVVYLHKPTKLIKMAANLFVAGVILFSGSIYALVFLKSAGQIGLGGLGILTPLGGVLFIIAWLLFVIGLFKKN